MPRRGCELEEETGLGTKVHGAARAATARSAPRAGSRHARDQRRLLALVRPSLAPLVRVGGGRGGGCLAHAAPPRARCLSLFDHAGDPRGAAERLQAELDRFASALVPIPSASPSSARPTRPSSGARSIRQLPKTCPSNDRRRILRCRGQRVTRRSRPGSTGSQTVTRFRKRA